MGDVTDADRAQFYYEMTQSGTFGGGKSYYRRDFGDAVANQNDFK